MFTGIIEARGKVEGRESRGEDGFVLRVSVPFRDLALGESVAVDGVCLTVAECSAGEARFFASRETAARTSLDEIRPGDFVNLERAVRAQDRLSGHLVQGHVDGLARLAGVVPAGDAFEIAVELPRELLRYVVEKGSIALDGISLTVNSIKDSLIYIMIIPHTWRATGLHSKQVGQVLNVEVDVVAKYVERFYELDPRGHRSDLTR